MTTILDADLEDLLTESTGAEAAPPDLDDLLAESMARAKEAAIGKTLRGKQRQGYKLGDDDLLRLRQWESKHEWRGVANAALFYKTTCAGCGRQQTIFQQLLRREEHRHLKDTTRWVNADSAETDLPNEIVVKKFRAGMCTHCCERAGFTFKVAKEFEE